MRTLLLAGILVTGAAMGTDVADGQEKKDEPKKAKLDPKFDEKVQLLRWLTLEKKFVGTPVEIDAYRRTNRDKKETFVLGGPGILLTKGKPTPKSEITDKDGAVWTITDVEGGPSGGGYVCVVIKKSDPPKKEEKKPE